MKKYTVSIKLITDYLQARFTEDAQKELEELVSKGIVKLKEDAWRVLMHQDEKGIYIPNIQIRNSLVNAGRDLKLKKQRRSLQQWVISNVMINPEKIYLNKKDPDRTITSYPARKDGNRVKLIHPTFNAGTQVKFELSILEDIEEKSLQELIRLAGKNYGIRARRRDMFGRYELVEMKMK